MNEVRQQQVLRYFGSLLAVTHILTCYFWLLPEWRHVEYLTDGLPLCWPFLHGCESWPRLSPEALFAILAVYVVVAGLSAFLFLTAKWARTAFVLLGVASVIKLLVFLLDYRMSGNYHYMHFWVLAAFLFVPQKALAIRFLLVAFYFAAGLLKLNYEWLSGAALPEGMILDGVPLALACAYVVLLELVLVFGLLSEKREIFWVTLAQLFLFHLVSFFVVGFYYPSLLFCFLALFILCERENPGDFKWRKIKELKILARIFLGVFVFLQGLSWAVGGDRAVDGRGRLVALNMFDANTKCSLKVRARFKDRTERLPEQYSPYVQLRLRCDPYVVLADVQHRCRQYAARPGFLDIDFIFKSKRRTDKQYQLIFELTNFCSNPKRMDMLGFVR